MGKGMREFEARAIEGAEFSLRRVKYAHRAEGENWSELVRKREVMQSECKGREFCTVSSTLGASER